MLTPKLFGLTSFSHFKVEGIVIGAETNKK